VQCKKKKKEFCIFQSTISQTWFSTNKAVINYYQFYISYYVIVYQYFLANKRSVTPFSRKPVPSLYEFMRILNYKCKKNLEILRLYANSLISVLCVRFIYLFNNPHKSSIEWQSKQCTRTSTVWCSGRCQRIRLNKLFVPASLLLLLSAAMKIHVHYLTWLLTQKLLWQSIVVDTYFQLCRRSNSKSYCGSEVDRLL